MILSLFDREENIVGNVENAGVIVWEWFKRTNLLILTSYHTMPHFEALKIYNCGKHCEKRRNCLLQAIPPFLTMFSTLCGTYFSF